VLGCELLVLLDEPVDDRKVIISQQHYILISTCRTQHSTA
jgi:hypothetical protein